MRRRSILSLAILTILVPRFGDGAASAAAPGLTPHQVARIRTVAAVVVSPDGADIAYTLSVPRDPLAGDDGPAWTELHVARSDDRTLTYVGGEVNVSAVAWRPGGGEITFLAKRKGEERRSLHAIALTGGEARRLFAHEEDIASYSWNPDGKRIVFVAAEPETPERQELSEKGFDQKVVEENLRPDGVWVVDVTEDQPEARRVPLSGHPSQVSWDPAGDRLALALAPTPLVDDSYMKRRIHVVSAGTGVVESRIENPGKLGSVVWSPDGNRLAVIASADLHDPAPGRLMMVSALGGALRDLLPGLEGHVSRVAWQDASTLVYVVDQGVETVVARLDVGSPEDRIELPTEGPDASRPSPVFRGQGLVVTDVALSADGTAGAMRVESPEHPREVYRLSLTEGTATRVTESNSWLAGISMGTQELVSWTARDGLELQGVLIHPVNEEPGRRYPLIMVVHGGPESHHRNGWLTNYGNPGQVAAARGYAVFYPNYRASTGRGVAFSKLDHGDFAGKEFDDLVDAIDHLVETGLVDRARVGVTGRSYGGYASAWCATALSEHFAASVMGVGLSNQISFFGTTDIPNEMNWVHYRMWPWENWQLFLERSPVYHVENARTPILIMHGAADTRVYPGQSMELYRYLKTYGQTPVRLVLHTGEGHGNRRAASRLDYGLRLLRWMDHYLKGPGGDPPPADIDYAEEAWRVQPGE